MIEAGLYMLIMVVLITKKCLQQTDGEDQ